MKLQSAIEFLSVYGFALTIIILVITFLFLFASTPKQIVPAQCTAYGGPTCLNTYFYTNQTGKYALVTVLLSDSQSVPINITQVNGIILGINGTGACNPTLVYVGQETVCKILVNTTIAPYVLVTGVYFLKAQYCDQNFQGISAPCSVTDNVIYGGAFRVVADPAEYSTFAVSAGQIIPSIYAPVFEQSPLLYYGGNLSILQNSDWVTNPFGYAYATAGVYLGSTTYVGDNFLGFKELPFPNATSILTNYNVHCGATSTSNDTFSEASEVYYMRSDNSIKMAMYIDDGGEIYYKPSNSLTWNSVFGGIGWHGQTAALYGPNTIIATTTNGFYDITFAWFNHCSIGLQAINISGGTP